MPNQLWCGTCFLAKPPERGGARRAKPAKIWKAPVHTELSSAEARPLGDDEMCKCWSTERGAAKEVAQPELAASWNAAELFLNSCWSASEWCSGAACWHARARTYTRARACALIHTPVFPFCFCQHASSPPAASRLFTQLQYFPQDPAERFIIVHAGCKKPSLCGLSKKLPRCVTRVRLHA
eukprot:1146760-Pelagomonas_calceolata.AAC.2